MLDHSYSPPSYCRDYKLNSFISHDKKTGNYILHHILRKMQLQGSKWFLLHNFHETNFQS